MERPEVVALDGKHVRAMTFASIEYDRPAHPVEGTLEVRHVKVLGYVQCLIDGTPVDSETVELMGD